MYDHECLIVLMRNCLGVAPHFRDTLLFGRRFGKRGVKDTIWSPTLYEFSTMAAIEGKDFSENFPSLFELSQASRRRECT